MAVIAIALVQQGGTVLLGHNDSATSASSARNQVVSPFLRQSSTLDRDNGGTLIAPKVRILVGIVGFACVCSLAFSQDNLEFPFQAAVLNKDVTLRSGTGEFPVEDSQSVPTSGLPQPVSAAVVAQSENNAFR